MSDATTPPPDVEIYVSDFCGFCMRARRLLDSKGVEYEIHTVDGDPELRQEMIERARRTSVPQIFIGGRHVGGSDDLYALERAGELDALLGASDAATG